MPRVHDGAVGHGGQDLQAVVHRGRVAAGEVGAAAPVEEQRVAAHQSPVDVKALTPRRVARRVDERDGDVAHLHHVAALVLHQLVGGEPAGAQDPRCLVALHVHRAAAPFEQRRHALELMAHQVAADVVGVEVRGQHAGDDHAVGFDHVDERVDVVGRVDQYALALLAVADGVDEVHHLLRDGVVGGEVATGEQLTEVEAIGTHRAHATR